MVARNGGIVGIAGVDLDGDLRRGLVEGGDGALRERQRIVVDGEIANGDAVRSRRSCSVWPRVVLISCAPLPLSSKP